MQAPSPASRRSYGPGPEFEPADLDRFVGQKPVRPAQDLLLEFSIAGFAHKHSANLDLRVAALDRLLEISLGPGGDHVRHIDRVALLAQQVIGAGERNETLGMFGRGEDPRRIVDAHGVVGRRMEYQQRLAQSGHALRDALFRNVVEEFALDPERPPGERHLDFSLFAYLVDLLLEQAGHVRRIAGRRDGDHRARIGDAMCGGQHRRPAEAVTDQNCRSAVFRPQEIRGGDQVIDVRGKMRIGEIAFAGAEPGEIEAQHADATHRQPLGNALGREVIFAAGEAVREQSKGCRLAQRQIEQRRELFAFGIGKFEPLGAHG